MTKVEFYDGIVVRTHGGHYYVQSGHRLMDCSLRGRLKKEKVASDLVVIGDRVHWSPTTEEEGIIEEVLPRKSFLARTSPPPRTTKHDAYRSHAVQQIIVANLDQVLVVFAVSSPAPNPLMLDRYLVACEAAQLPSLIVANKVDLLDDDGVREMLELYRHIGYEVLYTSAVSGEGLEALRGALRGKLSVLTGPSGVGKSSLLNALWPDLDLETGEISADRDRGRHTTVVARLLNPEPGTLIADTPGMRQFRFWDIDPEQLDAFFPEMRPYLSRCHFAPCTHMHEPDCAVQAAVERDEINPMRYESYRRMFEHGF